MEDIQQIKSTSTPKRANTLNQFSLKMETPRRVLRSSSYKQPENAFSISTRLEPPMSKNNNLNLYNNIYSSQKDESSNKYDDSGTRFQFSEFIKHNSSLTNSPKSLTPYANVNSSMEMKINSVTQKVKNNRYRNAFDVYDMNINNALKPALRWRMRSLISSSPIDRGTISHPSKIENKVGASSNVSFTQMCSSPIAPKCQLLDYEDCQYSGLNTDNSPQSYHLKKLNDSQNGTKNDFIKTDPNLEFFDIENKENNLIYQTLLTSQESTYSVIGTKKDCEQNDTIPDYKPCTIDDHDEYRLNEVQNKQKRGRKRKAKKRKYTKKNIGKIKKNSVLKNKTNTIKTPSPIKKVVKIETIKDDIPLNSTSSYIDEEDYKDDEDEEEDEEEYLPNRQTRSRRRLLNNKIGESNIEKKKRRGLRSKNGCWTCRVRHKACPENKPICGQCERLKLECDYSKERPAYMTNAALQVAKLREIRDITSKQKKVNFVRKRAN